VLSVQLRRKAMVNEQVEALVGTHAKPEHIALRAERDVAVFKPDGGHLLTLRREAVSLNAVEQAYPFLHGLRKQTTRNRGDYGGLGREQPVRKSGKRSNTTETPPIRSAVVGSFDRYPRMPFCRQCALSAADPEAWGACLPLIQEVARIFENDAPARYQAQLSQARETHPAYVIPGTPFTTLTVNNTVAGAYHRDAGDYKPGFGVMLVLRRGSYSGAELVLPAFGVGVDLCDRDVILFDVHEVHGNTPISGEGEPTEDHERISVVFYYRNNMIECLSPAEELERVKNARGSLEGNEP
jgi:hypothetical protein